MNQDVKHNINESERKAEEAERAQDTTATQDKAPEQDERSASKTDKGKEERPFLQKAKLHSTLILVVCSVLFLALFTIVNISSLSTFFSAILSVLTPILLGGAMAYLLNPILKLYEFKVFKRIKKKSVLRGLSLLMTYITALLIVIAFAFLLIPQLIQSVMDFASKFDSYLSSTTNVINSFISKMLDYNNMESFVDEEALLGIITNLLSSSGSLLESVAGYIVEYGMGLVIGIKNLVLAIFISIYILSSKERLLAQTYKLTTAIFSEKGKGRFYKYLYLCHKTFGGFFIGKIIDSLIIGVITLVALLIFNMPYVLLISTIVCVTNIIPVFGPIIGAIPSFFIILIADPPKALLFLILILLIQQLDGNVIGPKILGNSTGLSSLGVIISIIIMSEYFGVIGMIIGVPIFAVIVAIFKEFLETRLKAKNRPTDTADYYASDSLVDPHQKKHESILVRTAKHLSPSLHALAKRAHLKKQSKKESKATPETQETSKNEKEEQNKQ